MIANGVFEYLLFALRGVKRGAAVFALALSVYLSPPVSMIHAVEPDEVLEDKALEARARALSAGLRCMVCQNQSIDDSDAPLAKDLRLLVRERLSAGDSDDDVINYLVSRYGEFVLLQPKFALHTLLLWGSAPLVLLVGGGVIFLSWRKKKSLHDPEGAAEVNERAPLTDEEEKELSRIIKENS